MFDIVDITAFHTLCMNILYNMHVSSIDRLSISVTCQTVRWCALSIFTCASVASCKARVHISSHFHAPVQELKG